MQEMKIIQLTNGFSFLKSLCIESTYEAKTSLPKL